MTSVLRLAAVPAALSAVLLLAPDARADAPRTRDGLYLRLGLGASGLSMSRAGHLSAGGSAPAYTGDSTIAGGGTAFELTLGGTLRPGLVLAGTFVEQTVADPSLRSNDGNVALEGQLHYALLGATLAWFPQPNGGFHLGFTLAAAGAWAKAPPPRFTEYLGGSGGALALDAGYLWWVADQWSIGLSARLSGARLHGEVTQLGITGSEDDRVGAFMLAFSAVYH
jgi:hypothetical protein